MKKNWILYLLVWQIGGGVISLIISLPQDNFHAFIYYLMFSLSYANCIAVVASALLLLFERRVAHRLKSKYVTLFFVLAIAGISIYTGIRVVPPIIHDVCSMEIAHDVDKKHIYMVAGNIFLWLLVIISYAMIFIYHRLKRASEKQIREIESLKRLQVEAQYAILQAKVNPHFLFNTLNTILDLVYKTPDKVETIILNLSTIYRRVLNLPESEAIPLMDEIDLVRTYLEIEKIRFNERLNYELSLSGNLEACLIPPLIIQTLVENAVIHGIAPKKEGGKVTVKTDMRSGGLDVIVEDDGTGLKDQQRTSGFGLYGVKERLKLYYQNRARFQITNPPQGGTRIIMTIPVTA